MPYSGKEVQYQDISIKPFNIRNLTRMDWWMPIIVMSLVVCGWIVMYSAARSTDMSYFYRQIIFFAAGLFLPFMRLIATGLLSGWGPSCT